MKMDFQEIIAGTVGKENTFGTCVGLIKPEKMSFARFSTDDTAGKMRGYVGEGRVHRRSAEYLRRRGRGRDSRDAEAAALHLRKRLRASRGRQSFHAWRRAVHEATTRYLGWDMYWHPRESTGAC